MRKSEVSVERMSVCNVVENLACTVYHTPIPVTSEICYQSNFDVILILVLRHWDAILLRYLAQQLVIPYLLW